MVLSRINPPNCLPLGHVSRIIEAVDHRAAFDTLDFKTKATDGAALASDPQFGTFSPKTFQITTSSLPTKTRDPYSSGSFGGQNLLCQKDSHDCFWNKIPWFFFLTAQEIPPIHIFSILRVHLTMPSD